jgi:hypothetical protein
VKRAVVAAAVLVLAACGGEERPYLTAAPAVDRWCKTAGTSNGRTFRACYEPMLANDPAPPAAKRHGRLEVREREGHWRRLAVPHPLGAKPGEPAAGHWDWAAVSPDGDTLLAQWTAECEVPLAFFVPSDGGKAVPVVTGRYGPLTSLALGWTADGRAIVGIPGQSCGSTTPRPGTYLVRPRHKPEYWRPLGELSRSTKPFPTPP